MEFNAATLAGFLNGEIVGDPDVRVNTIAKIEEGHPGALSFLANPKYEHYIYTTLSSIVLVNSDFVPGAEIGATLIKVKNAYEAFASLLQLVDLGALGIHGLDLAGDHGALVVDRREGGEGVGVELLDAQRDALAVDVNSQHQRFHLLALFVLAHSSFAGLVPGQVG